LLGHEADEREAAALEVEAMADLAEAQALSRAYRANRLLAEALSATEDAADVERALLSTHEALRLVPDFSAALVATAALYRRGANRPDLALGWVVQALELVDEEAEMGIEGDNPNAWVELGEVRAALGDPLSATAAYLGAALFGPEPSDPKPHLRLIQVYKRLGMLEELYAAMDTATRLGADVHADLDPGWADLLAQVEVSAIKSVVCGVGEEEQDMTTDAEVSSSGSAPANVWDDSGHV
jgi:tetratricopeptide (TPR) repeat protein